MVTYRMDEINELIRKELALLIQRNFPDFLVSVTQVKVSKDLSYAKVWISSLTDPEKVVRQLQKEAGSFRKTMAGKVILRRVPSLHFVADLTGVEANKIDRLLQDIKDEEK